MVGHHNTYLCSVMLEGLQSLLCQITEGLIWNKTFDEDTEHVYYKMPGCLHNANLKLTIDNNHNYIKWQNNKTIN